MASPSIPRHRIFWPWLLCIALLAVASLPSAQPVQAQAGWSIVALPQGGGGRNLEPDVAFDSQGYTHVVYFAGSSQDAWSIYYTNNRANGEWSPPVRISEVSGEQRSPDIAIGSNGHIHVVYEKRKDADIYYVESPDLGATWNTPVDISRTGAKCYEPAVTVDANNTVHAVWGDRRWSGVASLTYSAKAPGADWTAPGRIGTGGFDRWPDITTSGSGSDVRVQVVFQGRDANSNINTDFDLYFATTAAGRFVPARNVTNDDGTWSLEPAIISNGANELYVAWDTLGTNGTHDVVFMRSTDFGTNWTSPRNLTARNGQAVTPSMAFSRGGGTERVHVVWDEDGSIYYTQYLPVTNTFGASTERVSDQSEAKEAGVAGSPITGVVSISFQGGGGGTQRAYLSSRNYGGQSGPVPTIASTATTVPPTATPLPEIKATLRLNNGASLTNSSLITATLSDIQGSPSAMRYAWNKLPTDATNPWLPIQTTFTVAAPTDTCTSTLFVQFQATDGRTAVISDSTRVDTEVQAGVEIRNTYFDGSNSIDSHTNRELIFVRVSPAGECSGLKQFYFNDEPIPFAITANGINLPFASVTDGTREAKIRVEDNAGNSRTYSRIITFDRVPPTLITGTLTISAPETGLPTVLAQLVFDKLQVTDDIYRSGYWNIQVANVISGTTVSDASLAWAPAPAQVTSNGSVVASWSVASGITNGNAAELAGKDIVVRVRFIDGAGNVSTGTLSAVVKLASDFQPITNRIPLISR